VSAALAFLLKISQMHKKIEFVKKEIQTAFLNIEYPGDNHLLYHPTCEHEECLEIKRIFTGKIWKNIKLEDIQYQDYVFSFFSTKAYRYYLPAFMIIVLDNYIEADVVAQAVVYKLTPPTKDHKPRKAWLDETVSGFNEIQKTAIKLFLETIRDYYGDEWAEIALKNVWG